MMGNVMEWTATPYAQLGQEETEFEHLLAAYRRARRGKRSRPDVAAFEFGCEGELIRLREDLREGRHQPGPYRRFYAVENGKRRVISAAPFRRSFRVVQSIARGEARPAIRPAHAPGRLQSPYHLIAVGLKPILFK
jgi:hypothetical protein